MSDDLVLRTGEPLMLAQVRVYFAFLFEAEQSGEQFPVDFDRVWPMAYRLRENAIRALVDESGCYEGEDWILLNSELNSYHRCVGRPKEQIPLSISCLEYFIVKKIRPIFEIDRQCRIAVTEAARAWESSSIR